MPFPVRVRLVQPLPRCWAMCPEVQGSAVFPAAAVVTRLRASRLQPAVFTGSGTSLGPPFSPLGCPRLLPTGMRGPRPAEAHSGKWRKLYVVHFLIGYMLKWHLCSLG